MNKAGLIVALVLVVSGNAAPFGYADIGAAVAQRGVVKPGEPAPNFQLRDLNGRVVALSDLRGKVVLLNFWATWCGPCRVEMPAMERLYRAYDRKDFEILAVSTDAQGVAVTRPFQQENKLTFPILHDADFRVGLSYGARTLPMTFMVDREGIVRQHIFGARDWEAPEAHQLIEMLMHSANVDEIFAEDYQMRKKMREPLRRQLAEEDELQTEVRNQLKHVKEGSQVWEVEYRRMMEEIKRRKGL